MAMRSAGWRRLVLRAPAQKPEHPQPEGEAGAPEADVACIQHGVEMAGRLVMERSIRIEGEFRGEIESGGSIVVAESGAV